MCTRPRTAAGQGRRRPPGACGTWNPQVSEPVSGSLGLPTVLGDVNRRTVLREAAARPPARRGAAQARTGEVRGLDEPPAGGRRLPVHEVSPEHLSEPGLVVIDNTAADEATAVQAASALGGLRLSSGPSAPGTPRAGSASPSAPTPTSAAHPLPAKRAGGVGAGVVLARRHPAPKPHQGTG
ncbi:DUF6207 family protein [Streptomyces sp. NPDC059008]|uniref:DUF6207 family protein n=1 Tax=Streptomyces sp. NPDC059008 TaxID=3346693 RepID=UPI0036B0E3B0